jgi:hypothetical protein
LVARASRPCESRLRATIDVRNSIGAFTTRMKRALNSVFRRAR